MNHKKQNALKRCWGSETMRSMAPEMLLTFQEYYPEIIAFPRIRVNQ